MYKRILFSLVVSISFICSLYAGGRELIVCGDSTVLIIDPHQSEGENVKIKWSWKISEATEIPPEYQKYLFPLDECKPIDNNTKLLITASGGGVVLLERKTKKVLFYTHSPMAHSADMLPGNRIVVALSNHPNGDAVEVYDLAVPEKCIFRDTLHSGHGAVWMAKRKRLYVLGEYEIRSYSLEQWNSKHPTLKKENSWQLPEIGGHDLVAISKNELVASVAESVWVFDIEKETFQPFDKLNVADVKSINFNKKNNNLVYTKAETVWWTHNIYMENPNKVITIPHIKLYKVRVFPIPYKTQ